MRGRLLMKIKYLVDCQEHLPVISSWLYDSWGDYYPDSGREKWDRDLADRLNKEQVPTTFVAFEGGDAAGTASLIEDDLPIRPKLTPWLADVFVPRDYRSQGIATKLVERVTAEVRLIGLDRFYLFTREAKEFYLKIGWQIREFTLYRDKEIHIMQYDL